MDFQIATAIGSDVYLFLKSATDAEGTSSAGIVFITKDDKVMQKSQFIQSNEGWNVITQGTISSTWSATSVGDLNHFIYADDIPLVLNSKNTIRWSFDAPSKFYGNYGMAYNGFLQFYMTSFSGDFSSNTYPNPKTFISIECSTCNSGNGLMIAQVSAKACHSVESFSKSLMLM